VDEDYDCEMYLIMQELSYPVPHSTLAVVETYFYHLCTDNNRPYLDLALSRPIVYGHVHSIWS